MRDILRYSNTFVAETTDKGVMVRVTISDKLKSVEERTVAINEVFRDLQSSEDRYPCLKGWRDEV